MRIFIDNIEIDVDNSTKFRVSMSQKDFTDLKRHQKQTKTVIDLPMTARNATLFQYAYEPHGEMMFNNSAHTIRITKRGATIAVGAVYLQTAKQYKAGAFAKGRFVCVMSSPRNWIDIASEQMFNEIPIEFNQVFGELAILNSWTWGQPVRFLPVRRDNFLSKRCSGTLIPVVQILSPENYHPFIHIGRLVGAIAGKEGYKVESEFFNQPFFDSLYMSGNYPSQEQMAVRMKSKQDFLAGRLSNSSAVADTSGSVYTSITRPSANSLGCVVDTADPAESGLNGPAEGVFNTNNCFRKLNGMAIFKPMLETMVAFEYDLSYTSQYKIKDRQTLTGFDEVVLDGMMSFKYTIPNVFTDWQSAIINGMTYTVIVFNHTGGDYRLYVDTVDNPLVDMENIKPSDHSLKLIKSFSSRVTTATILMSTKIIRAELHYRSSTSSQYVKYADDWALYEGAVGETGNIDIGLIVRSGFTRVLPSSHVPLDMLIFKGAQPGMSITLGRATTIKPIFLSHPSIGSVLKFKDVATHRVRQIKLLEAIKHMFNLRFHTDELNKILYIEPRDSFYCDQTVDWSHKLDTQRPVEIEELGLDEPKRRLFRFRDGDGMVARWDEVNQQVYGSWEAEYTKFAENRELVVTENALFTASLSVGDEFPGAADALLIQAGNRDRSENVLDEDLNFVPKIVSYQGLVDLPIGQRWGFPSYGRQYPYLTFCDYDRNISLRYDDSYSNRGLRRFYDKQIRLSNESRRVRLYVWLSPEDIEPFVDTLQPGANFRNLFLIKVVGETLRLRLEEIVDYDPEASQSTQCVFIKEL